MKKILLLSLSLFLSAGLFAQISIEKAYFGGGIGFSKVTGELVENGAGGGGISFILDGGVFIQPKIAVGLEGNWSLHGFEDVNEDVNFNAAGLYLAKGEYYFLDRGFSPFVGLGLGVATVESVFSEGNKVNLAISPRAGFVAGGFHMEFIYNLAGKTPNFGNIEGKRYNFWTLSLGYRYIFES